MKSTDLSYGSVSPCRSGETTHEFAVQAKELCFAFGGQKILDKASFALESGSISLLRGDNGAGKTTLLNILTGFLHPDKGQILLNIDGSVIDANGTPPEQRVRLGIGRLWQDIRLFPTMTALENVLSATPGLSGQNPLFAIAAWPLVRRQEREARDRAIHYLSLVGMSDRASSSGDKLSIGQMKRVALARLLQSGAKLILLDEPLAGLDAESAKSLLKTINELRHKEEKTFFIIEHQHERISGICDATWFLADGKISPNGND